MSAHTKGPWVISGGGSLHLSVLSQDDEQTIADVWFIRRDPEEGNANARLIAAAPELLEALRVAREVITQDRTAFADCSTGPDNTMEPDDLAALVEYDEALWQIDAAIAKAEGRS